MAGIININEIESDLKSIDFFWSDKKARDDYEEFNRDLWPFMDLAKIKKDSGVYLFCEPQDDYGDMLLPLYAGRTVSFSIRFNQYLRAVKGSWIIEYDKSCQNEETHFGKNPFINHIFIWFELDSKKRVKLEHDIISKFNPIFNKG
jgi:hypothetical protein